MSEAIQFFPIYEDALTKEKEYSAIKSEITLQMMDAWQFNQWEEFEKVRARVPESIRKATNGKDNCRNINFANKIIELLKAGKPHVPFIMIGAAHFLGEDGLLALLRKEGAHIDFIDLNTVKIDEKQ